MRKSIIALVPLLLLAACTSPEPTDLDSLVTEKDSLKNLVNSYNDRISEINKLIAESAEDFESNLTLVRTQTLTEQPFSHSFTIYGEVASDKNVLLYPEMAGVVERISVQEGSQVRKGDIILSIDDQILQNQIAEVRTAYELAKTTYEKQARLWEQRIGSELQYLQAKNQKESLESSLATLNSQAAKTRIRAPFSGTLDEIFPNQGEMANPQMPVARIVNLKKMYIESDVSEQHVLAVKEGTPVAVEFPGIGEQVQTSIQETSKYINPENRSFKIRVELPETEFELKPNQLAHLSINDYVNEKAIVIPSAIIMQSTTGADYVYVLEESEGRQFAKRVAITTGKEYKGQVEVIDGLEPDMQIITEGARSVRDGQRVRLS
ncbi:MAG: efflux RND transporter periplasmic adaptor subunit [Flavobacteriales bacterium]|nr:efflux RND transporter periplasmic adaptor subunit [Flavobacteriales bacterium]